MSLEVAIPDTTLTECSDLREKTVKTGRIGRALAIFRVERVIVYSTGRLKRSQLRDRDILMQILRYMDTPQYLRRRVFSKRPSLKFVGLLPPLRTRSHPLAVHESELKVGDVRWGIGLHDNKVDIGLEKPVKYRDPVDDRHLSVFRVIKTHPDLQLEVIDRSDTEEYFGFEVVSTKDLVSYLHDSPVTTKIALSRNAPPFHRLESDIKATVKGTMSVLALFGGPGHGISDILTEGGTELKQQIDFWVNTIHDQGTETVRLDEAIFTSLSLLNNSLGDLVTRGGYHQPS